MGWSQRQVGFVSLIATALLDSAVICRLLPGWVQSAEVRIHGRISDPTAAGEHNKDQICTSSIGLSFLEQEEAGLDISAEISKGQYTSESDIYLED